jgi:hypothetical protein
MSDDTTPTLTNNTPNVTVVATSVTEGTPATPGETSAKESGGDIAGTVFAVFFWLAILGIAGFSYLRSENADVMLDVLQGQSLQVSGQVLVGGVPADNGRVHIVVNDGEKRYLASTVVPVVGGVFKQDQPLALTMLNRKGLRVTADYRGVTAKTAKKDGGEAIEGTATAYVDVPTPLAPNKVVAMVASVVGLILILIFLFTGELTQVKARALFAATYFMTFLSLALPIGVTVLVSDNSYLLEIMKKAPIGLVQGRTDGMKADEWLLNIGGTATRPERAVVVAPIDQRSGSGNAPPPVPPAATRPTDDETAKPAGASGGGPNTATTAPPSVVTTGLVAPPRPDANTTVTSSGAVGGQDGSDTQAATFVGGLAVPFYIVMLAMLGAGINMTRQVPKIQAIYDQKITPRTESVLIAVLHAPGSIFRKTTVTDGKEREAAAIIRKQLIDSYMYLLAAPFLAIAVFYMLQVVATTTATPVLVVMAFATGLISDSIVSGIMNFAESTIAKVSPPKEKDEDQPPDEETPGPGQVNVVGVVGGEKTPESNDVADSSYKSQPAESRAPSLVTTDPAPAIQGAAAPSVDDAVQKIGKNGSPNGNPSASAPLDARDS